MIGAISSLIGFILGFFIGLIICIWIDSNPFKRKPKINWGEPKITIEPKEDPLKDYVICEKCGVLVKRGFAKKVERILLSMNSVIDYYCHNCGKDVNYDEVKHIYMGYNIYYKKIKVNPETGKEIK